MQPHVFEQHTQYSITETSLSARREQFSTSGFQQLPILDARRANLLTCATAEAAIDMPLEGQGVARQSSFTDSAH
jgi:hypothetical protein